MTAPFRLPAQITSSNPTVNENVDHKATPISHSTIVEEGNPEQTHFLPSEPTKQFDTRPYQQVKQMQTALAGLNQTFIASHVLDLITKDPQLGSFIKSTINPRSTPAKNQTDLAARINTLSMKTKANKGQVFDGKWGQNTDNALMSALSIAGGMISICQTCKAPLSFETKDWQTMRDLINHKGKLSTQQRAVELTTLITKLKDSVGTFVETLQANAPAKDTKLSINNAPQKTYPEATFLANHDAATVGNLHVNRIPVHYKDLANLSAFKEFLKSAYGQEPTQQSIVQTIKDLKGQLGQSTAKKPGQP